LRTFFDEAGLPTFNEAIRLREDPTKKD